MPLLELIAIPGLMVVILSLTMPGGAFSDAIPVGGSPIAAFTLEQPTQKSWAGGVEVATLAIVLLISALLARLAYLLPKSTALASQLDTLKQASSEAEHATGVDRAEETLHRTHLLLESYPAAALWLDRDGRVRATNSALERLVNPSARPSEGPLVGSTAQTGVPIRLVDQTGTLSPADVWLHLLRDGYEAQSDSSFSTLGVLVNQDGGSVSLRITYYPRVSQKQKTSNAVMTEATEALVVLEERTHGLDAQSPDQTLALEFEGLRWLASEFGQELEMILLDLRTQLAREGSLRAPSVETDPNFRATKLLPAIKMGQRTAAQLTSFASKPSVPSPNPHESNPEDRSDSHRKVSGRPQSPPVFGFAPGIRTHGLKPSDLLSDSLAAAGFSSARKHISERLPMLAVDSERVRFVMQCILATCRRLMQPGDELCLETRLVRATGELDGNKPQDPRSSRPGSRDSLRNTANHVQIVITGVSGVLDKSAISNLFHPARPSESDSGLGVGFAAAKEIIRRQKGSFAVASKPAEGTCFTLTLPVAAAQEKPRSRAFSRDDKEPSSAQTRSSSKPAARSATSPAEKPSSASPLDDEPQTRILVMDDEQSILALLTAALKRLGFDPVVTKNGEEAIAATEEALQQKAQFRLAILDLTIPAGMGGVETASNLRKLQPSMTLVASSGYAQNPALIEFEAFGFDAVLVKPYRIPDLSALLDRLLLGD